VDIRILILEQNTSCLCSYKLCSEGKWHFWKKKFCGKWLDPKWKKRPPTKKHRLQMFKCFWFGINTINRNKFWYNFDCNSICINMAARKEIKIDYFSKNCLGLEVFSQILAIKWVVTLSKLYSQLSQRKFYRKNNSWLKSRVSLTSQLSKEQIGIFRSRE
jgi:hypothetical protein